MKTYCKGLVVDEALVTRAYEKWARSDAGRKNAWRIEGEHGSPEALAGEIVREIRHRNLALRPIHRYRYREPTNGKVRTIGVESVKQQVCDYVAVEALASLLAAKVGFWQVASVPGKGQGMAARTVRRWVQEGGYHVHLDVRRCYPSIKTNAVMRVLDKYVRSPDALYLCGALLATYDGGLEIGSYFSLRMAQLLLSFAYHEVEGMGKCRRGAWRPLVAHQLWYADDVFLFGKDKRDLRMAARKLAGYLHSRFDLAVKPWKVCKTGNVEPVDCVGYTVRPGRTTLRTSLFLRLRRAFSRFRRRPCLRLARRVASYWGWLKHSDSRGFVARNHVKRTMDKAKALLGAYERRIANGGYDTIRNAA